MQITSLSSVTKEDFGREVMRKLEPKEWTTAGFKGKTLQRVMVAMDKGPKERSSKTGPQ